MRKGWEKSTAFWLANTIPSYGRKMDAASSARIAQERRDWPLIMITPPAWFGGYSANGATRTYSEQPTITWHSYAGRSNTWNTHLQSTSSAKGKPVPNDSINHRGATVSAIAAEDAAAAVVSYDSIVAYGGSKRNKHERKNADVGLDLAIGRAFLNLGKNLIDRANERLDS